MFYRLVSLFGASAANSGRGKNVTTMLSEKVTQLEKGVTDMKSQATSSRTKTKIVPTREERVGISYTVGRFLNAWLNVCVSGKKGKLRV